MSLDEVRQKIDSIDQQLLRLLNERAELVHAVGEIKR
ncbi:MAG: chorismate mutase, partial [Prosthecobacter sp.]|nr:chorismate mutase [Prosthecobacter sp.]